MKIDLSNSIRVTKVNHKFSDIDFVGEKTTKTVFFLNPS